MMALSISQTVYPPICTKDCPSGYYGDASISLCFPFNIECSTCIENPGKCLLCNAHLKYAVTTKAYKSAPLQCPDRYYEDLVDGNYQCSKCHQNCKSCIGNQNYQCL